MFSYVFLSSYSILLERSLLNGVYTELKFVGRGWVSAAADVESLVRCAVWRCVQTVTEMYRICFQSEK